jgi:hypothetical protein
LWLEFDSDGKGADNPFGHRKLDEDEAKALLMTLYPQSSLELPIHPIKK